jgi:Mlc titration factor MtfA (ptsG expression regulator)
MELERSLVQIIAMVVLLISAIAGVVYLFRNVTGILGIIFHSITPLPQEERNVLKKGSAYYNALTAADRRKFEKRVKEVLFEKEWIGRGIKITREVKVHIAASLVQLTFGLEHLLLLHFQRFIIHPSAYRDRLTGRFHLGGVAPGAGTVSLSWEHFEAGYADPADARNLGLHELAHAFWFENTIPNQEDDLIPEELLKQWKSAAQAEIERIKSGNSRLFRDYAGTNQAEFFAVAVEYFFEQPVQLKEKAPDLYDLMRRILKQDPANRIEVHAYA